jgi:hypothetical protein
VTESQFTGRLLIALRQALPGGEVIKHSDRYSTGIPDFSVSYGGRTEWFEVKLANNRRPYEPIQLARLQRLHGWYVIYNTSSRSADVIFAKHAGAGNDVSMAKDIDFPSLVNLILLITKGAQAK